MIRIRRATIEDVAYIAEGIYYAFLLEDEALYNQWIKILKDVCGQEDTHYSYRNTWIAEVDGQRAGMMIAVDGEHYREQRDKMYPQLKGLFDVAFDKGWDEMEDEAKAGGRAFEAKPSLCTMRGSEKLASPEHCYCSAL